MKHLAVLLVLAALSFPSSSFATVQGDEYLGQCKMQDGDFLVYQNKEQNVFRFQLVTTTETKEVVFDRKLTWLWYEVDASYWKFRNGRHNGVFSWNFYSRIGHLKYVKGEYYYWHLTECDINERAIAY
nr:hypothetical protein CKG001_15260 [Bdellovibrio sp. CKG001]BFD62799.1 hypothetical protein BdHM001_14800 [Bdellovibrio sp. HM001]